MLLLDRFLKTLIVQGDFSVIDASGQRRRYGSGTIPGIAPSCIRLADEATARRLALHPSLALGEAYMDGALTVEDGTIYDVLAVCLYNIHHAGRSGVLGWPDRVARFFRRRLMHNPLERSQRNVAHHYDLSEPFYRLFLDPDRQYSCAYYARPEMTLEDAQEAKKRHIAAKLLLKPGMRVLDIGCGWGGLALSLARGYGVSVTGITLSQEQLKVARARAEAEGLSDRVNFILCDYRHAEGRFDRIVSVGMFEHVGITHYDAFFCHVARLLADDGVALLHSIGRSDGPGITNAWVRKYIFPGGYVPALSEVTPAVEDARLIATDIEILRLHYALTLREWRRRFLERQAEAEQLYDRRFCRMWEFYLASSEAAFRYDDLMVFQLQLAKRIDAVPLVRDYITA